MAVQDIKGKHDRWIVAGLSAFLVLIWGLFAFLPLIVLRSAYFSVKTPADVDRVRSTLGQLGAYGDMFGALNCLFSGSALIGVVYAVILQRRELHHQQEEIEQGRRDRDAAEKARDTELKEAAAWQRRIALIQATSFLVQAQTARLEFLKTVDFNKLDPEKQPIFYEEFKSIVADTRGKIDILSVFVKTLAQEHSGDVDDPAGFLAHFGLAPEKAKEG